MASLMLSQSGLNSTENISGWSAKAKGDQSIRNRRRLRSSRQIRPRQISSSYAEDFLELRNTRSQARRTWLGTSKNGTSLAARHRTILNRGIRPRITDLLPRVIQKVSKKWKV